MTQPTEPQTPADVTAQWLLAKGYTLIAPDDRPMFARGRWGNPAALHSVRERWERRDSAGQWLATCTISEIPAYRRGTGRALTPASREVEVTSRGTGCFQNA